MLNPTPYGSSADRAVYIADTGRTTQRLAGIAGTESEAELEEIPLCFTECVLTLNRSGCMAARNGREQLLSLIVFALETPNTVS